MKQDDDIVIISGVRTAIGSMGKSLKDIHQHELGAQVIRAAVERATIPVQDIDEVIVGNVGQVAESGFVARVCQLRAGLPQEVTSYSVNRQCGSSLQSIANIAMQIKTKQINIGIAAGTENMSQLPYYIRKARYGYRLGHGELEDGITTILTWPDGPYHNGITAENVAEKFNVNRSDMDQFSFESQQKAIAAIEAGHFTAQILPIELNTAKQGEVSFFAQDEHPRATSLTKLSTLKPAFKPNGVITAGNSSGINDGAAALVMMSRQEAKARGLTPLMKVVGWDVAGCPPEIMGFGPAPATEKLMRRLNMDIHQIDLIELNEAFAAQALAVIRALKLDISKVNVNGGAIALGHPIGATGAILSVKMLYELQRTGAKTGLVTMCIGGGQGISMLFENEAA